MRELWYMHIGIKVIPAFAFVYTSLKRFYSSLTPHVKAFISTGNDWNILHDCLSTTKTYPFNLRKRQREKEFIVVATAHHFFVCILTPSIHGIFIGVDAGVSWSEVLAVKIDKKVFHKIFLIQQNSMLRSSKNYRRMN